MRRFATLVLATALFAPAARAQQTTPDVLLFTNGDQLTGHLASAAGGKVVFHSDMAGDISVPFDKIKELRSGSSSAQFALLLKSLPISKRNTALEGTISIADAKVTVTPGPTSTAAAIPSADVALLIPRAEFDRVVAGHEGFLAGWKGAVTGGATLVRSTTTGTTLTAALSLTRAMPTVSWLPPRNRTTLNVAESYGKNTSPGAIPQTTPPTPDVTTLSSIFHADTERDEYFSQRFYALAEASFDHNYAQGLQLQQVYGAGIGWTPFKTAHQQLDLKADLHYEKQQELAPTGGTAPPSTNLVGSTIFEGYHRDLPHKILFTESANILPAFNNSNAYSFNATAGLVMPVFKSLSAVITTTDAFLNDPAPGYQKNSFQFITGVTYTFATKP
ncbi:MAG: DUF481 domain-containing protein [Acidobacteriota bacterium]